MSFSLGEGRSSADSAADSLRRPTGSAPTERGDSTATATEDVATLAEPPSPIAAHDAWTVSFAAVLSEDRAREIAGEIAVDGQRPRVVKSETSGTTVFRVVFGPYNSKADAERMGRSSRHNYWVYEGVP